jgi:phosphomannomutase/phosphoglucomutase
LSIFKAYDIRGVWGKELTDEVVYRIGRGLSTMLRVQAAQPAVAVGGDVRMSTQAVRSALHKGLVDGGCRVTDIGVVPTPVLYSAVRELAPHAAAMITASHNPPEFNGLKLTLGREPLSPEGELREIVERGQFVDGKGSIRRHDAWAGYHRFLAEQFPERFNLKVAADAGNGAWSSEVVDTLHRLGFDVVPLFCEPDGTFPNRPPDPSKAKNISALRETVERTHAAIGVAFDGDGDRAVFVDDHGEPVDRDKIIVALSRDALADCADPANESVVYDASCSMLVPQAIRELGARPVMERVGYTFIRQRVVSENALFGAEWSGHFFYRQLDANDDGMYSFLRCARMVQRAGRPLSQILGAMPSPATTPVLRIPCGEHEGKDAIEAIANRAAGRYEVLRIDGVRVDYPDGWGLARMSATEPVISLRFEATTPQRLRPVIEEFLAPAPGLLAKTLTELFGPSA